MINPYQIILMLIQPVTGRILNPMSCRVLSAKSNWTAKVVNIFNLATVKMIYLKTVFHLVEEVYYQNESFCKCKNYSTKINVHRKFASTQNRRPLFLFKRCRSRASYFNYFKFKVSFLKELVVKVSSTLPRCNDVWL